MDDRPGDAKARDDALLFVTQDLVQVVPRTGKRPS